jgi:hypothetical protein
MQAIDGITYPMTTPDNDPLSGKVTHAGDR